MKRYVLATMVLVSAEVGGDETGVSRGPANPADLGSRCAVMAGRDDRAYLNCAEQEPSTPKANNATRIQRPDTDHPSSDSRPARRYPPSR
jgi:hypothetical protein